MKKKQIRNLCVAAIALIAVLAVNWLCGLVPTSLERQDTSKDGAVTLTEESRELVHSVDRPVTIYYVCTPGKEHTWVDTLVRRYAELSPNITLTRLDPTTAQADIVTRYMAEPTDNSLIVVSDLRSWVIPQSELFNVAYNPMMYYYYQQYVVQQYDFVAQARLNFALDFVTRTDMPVVYQLTGHGETELGSLFTESLAQRFIEVRSLNLAQAGAIPEGALALVENGPQTDLTAEESKTLLSYLKEGGRLLLTTNYNAAELPNLAQVTEYYGMKPVTGLVLDPADGAHFRDSNNDYPYYLLPAAQSAEAISQLAEGAPVCLAQAHAMEKGSIRRAGLKVETLFATSDSSYMKTNLTAVRTLDQEEEDVAGPFTVAMAAREGNTRVAWFASAMTFVDTANSITSGGQLELFQTLLRWMNDGELPEAAALQGVSLMVDPLTTDSPRMPVIYGLCIALPLIVLIVGLLVTRKRKAKK